jgi:hypothetical protein
MTKISYWALRQLVPDLRQYSKRRPGLCCLKSLHWTSQRLLLVFINQKGTLNTCIMVQACLYHSQVWNSKYIVRFEVLTAASMKMTVFWYIAPCSLVEIDRRFRGAYCLHNQGSAPTRRNIPEGCHVHTRCRENLKSHSVTSKFDVGLIIVQKTRSGDRLS